MSLVFLKFTEDSKSANKARPDIDGNKAWTAGAGAYALVTGMAQITWLFTQLNEELKKAKIKTKVLSSKEEWKQGGPGIYVWEAFINGPEKSALHDNPHIADCLAGINAFKKNYSVPYDQKQANFFSIIGAILLRTGCASDKSVLSTPCLVIKAQTDNA